MKYPFFLFLFCILTSPPSAHAQIEDLTQDADFFQKQTTVYQKWLNTSGLGTYLSVYDIEVEKDMLSIYLEFPFSDIDSIQNAWQLLQESWAAENAITLERRLLQKASFTMEVRQSMINVQLYDTYDLRKEPLFLRVIYFEDGEIKVNQSDPRDKRESITLSPLDMSGKKTAEATAFRARYQRDQVYGCILNYANNRYKKTECIERYPGLRHWRDGNDLVFEVTDLCREVLTDEANPTLCSILSSVGYDCNWVKREMLRFTITYEELAEGFRLVILIDGKYGSGFYDKVKRGGYIDMEEDFDDYLEIYAKAISSELRQALINCE